MKKEDARKLSPAAQEEKRKLAIKIWKTGVPQVFRPSLKKALQSIQVRRS